MSDGDMRPVGGYFELELPQSRGLPYTGLVGFQSARASFLALLRQGGPKKVWMPRHICNAMLEPLKAAGVEPAWYELNDDLDVLPSVKLGSGEWLLYVNYFGLRGGHVDRLLQRFPPEQVVLDYSQSFFSPPHEAALATIYSPRKFFGVPDGGLLHSQILVTPPDEMDAASFERTTHLIRRLGDSPEAGYAAYQRAEESLSDCEPRRMSKLTERILCSVDFEAASRIRKENFRKLHETLGPVNRFPFGATSDVAPLCYPFMTDDAGLRERLISNRIFVPTYWSDALDRVDTHWANNMIRNLLPLPLDQRYGSADMERMLAIILSDV